MVSSPGLGPAQVVRGDLGLDGLEDLHSLQNTSASASMELLSSYRKFFTFSPVGLLYPIYPTKMKTSSSSGGIHPANFGPGELQMSSRAQTP